MIATLRNPVRPAATSEVDQAVSTVVSAFIADPVLRAFFPEAHSYLTYFPQVVRSYAVPSSRAGSLYTAGAFMGAALWMPPATHPDEDLLAGVLEAAVPESRQEHLFGVLEKMGASHPSEPHWYLPLLGVDPAHQGRGYGSALLKEGLAVSDEQGCLAYLESTNTDNTRLYLRHGFEPVGAIRVAEGVVLTPMVRRPA